MKKLFIQPEIKVSMFFTENILTVSGDEDEPTNYSIIEGQIGNVNGGVASASFTDGSQE